MRLIIERRALRLEPESEIERAFIEDTLGLVNGGDSIPLIRVDLDANHQLSHLETQGRARRARKFMNKSSS